MIEFIFNRIHTQKGESYMKIGILNFSTEKEKGYSVALKKTNKEKDIIEISVDISIKEKIVPKEVTVAWDIDCIDMQSVWNPLCGALRNIQPAWRPNIIDSRVGSGAPIHSLVSASGKNRGLICVSDVKTPIRISTGVEEETSLIKCRVTFFTIPVNAIDTYSAKIRIDLRNIPYYDAIYDAEKWWSADGGYKSAKVPECAKVPLYSTWYSYHQKFTTDELLEQFKIAKEYGMDTVIVDDGWQTGDNNRGYAYCGDWEVYAPKVPDMKKFVDETHKLDMKYIMWYSIPFVGKHSKAFDEFKDMFLDDPKKDWCCLDPRFKKVREFLKDKYVNAAKDWGLDGFKLDFIDSMCLTEYSHFNKPGMDCQSLEDGIEKLLKSIMQELKKINKDIAIEFRQKYFGPVMKKYGNMLRVYDCPNDIMKNRMGVIDLRLMSGSTAIHSDMLMWNQNDTVENAARQIINILFSVPQISVDLKKMKEEHLQMIKFYLNFWKENRDTILNGKVIPYNPEACYTKAAAVTDKCEIVCAYSSNSYTLNANPDKLVMINGTGLKEMYLDSEVSTGAHKYEIYDCMGNLERCGEIEIDVGVYKLYVPDCGMVIFSK